MTRYELLTTLHVGAAIIWLGAGFLFAVLVFRAERVGDGAREAGYHRDVGEIGTTYFVPASLATFIFGLLLTIDGPWSFDELWITIGMAGWLTSFLLGFFYFKPEGQALGAMALERGPDDPELRRRIRRLNIVDRIQVTILFAVVADMVIKPTGDDSGVLIAGAAIIAAAIVLGWQSIRS